MNKPLIHIGRPPPPSFEQAKNRRQKVRAAGLDPNYWYPVEYSKRGQARAGDGGRVLAPLGGAVSRPGRALRAVENRCAHRQLKLSIGRVEDCQLVCPYHGWT
jgi:hypothetical protein